MLDSSYHSSVVKELLLLYPTLYHTSAMLSTARFPPNRSRILKVLPTEGSFCCFSTYHRRRCCLETGGNC